MPAFPSLRSPASFAGTLALIALIALVAVPSALADRGQSQLRSSAGEAESARDYWTVKRMRSAEPLALRPMATAPTESTSPVPPSASRDANAQAFIPENSRPGRPPAAELASPSRAPQFTSGPVPPATYETYPTSTNGKIFGKLRGFGRYTCSGTVVTSSSRAVVLTAGHCLHDRGAGFARKVVFVPAYQEGSRPFGTWASRVAVVTRQWRRGANNNYDFGAIRVSSPEGKIGNVVGEMGVAFDQPRPDRFQAFGYPFNRGAGEILYTCDSRLGGVDGFDRAPGPPASGIGCDMGPGASGGGWIIDTPAGPLLNSVSSYIYRALRNTVFGPYLSGEAVTVINRANRG